MTVRPTLTDLPDVDLRIRRCGRARRISLRVSRFDASVTLTVPLRVSLADAMAFARAQTEWLKQALARVPDVRRPAFGQALPFRGENLIITAAQVRAPAIAGDRLLMPPDPEQLGLRLEAFFKHCARLQLHSASTRYATQLGLPFRRITLRDTRSRWGSCAADGSLSYSWRLIMAPGAVLDYVAAHEVAHLAQMNHSPAFWAVVAQLRPGYVSERAWLKQNGNALHAIRFRDS